MSQLLQLSAPARRWAVAGGVLALIVAGLSWLRGATVTGLSDVYEMCELRSGAGQEPELVLHDDVLPLHITCVFNDGSTFDLIPDWVNPTVFLMGFLGLFLLGTVYANVLADAWRGPHPTGRKTSD